MIFNLFLSPALASIDLWRSHVVHLEFSSKNEFPGKMLKFPNGDLFSCQIPLMTTPAIFPADAAALRGFCFSRNVHAEGAQWTHKICSGGAATRSFAGRNVSLGDSTGVTLKDGHWVEEFPGGEMGRGVRVIYLCSDAGEESFEVNGTLYIFRIKTFLVCESGIADEFLKMIKDECLIENIGMWKYKLCVNGSTTQQSIEGSKTVEEFLIGKASQHLEIVNTDFSTLRRLFENVHGKVAPKHLRMHITGGDICDITGKPRTAQIWFQCDPEPGMRLVLALEPDYCTYRFIVNSSAACADPALRWRPRRVDEDAIKCRKLKN